MSAALNSVKPLKRHLKHVYFIVKSSCYSSQIKDVLKSAAPEWAPPPNERRIWSSENLKNAAALKRVNTVCTAAIPPFNAFSAS
jgi:hypothetical protein